MRLLNSAANMNEIEDVSFLPEGQSTGSSSTGKRSMYEPDGLQKCRQIVCSPRRAAIIIAVFVIIIFLIALIAAFARPSSSSGACGPTTALPSASPKTSAKPIATDGSPFPWSDIRLPTSITPLSYDLFLHPNLTTFKFTGNVSILFEVRKATDFVVFHSKDLKINAESVKVKSAKNGREVGVEKMLEYVRHEQIYLKLGETIKEPARYLMSMSFDGVLTDNLAGFYRSSYETRAGQKRWLATTHFEATDARAAFPCFDEPDLKANFTLAMVREEGFISLFNTEQVGTPERYGTSYYVDRFATSVTMSTYLVAFVVCDFGAKSAVTKGGVNVSVYAPKEMLNQTDFALTVAVKVLDFYEDYYGIKYPLKKSDHIAIPDFAAGAMENWGLITYLMRSLLYDSSESSADDKQWVAVVVAHELAHQWFGNLVTMKWWNDLWLNEGFARFVENLGTNSVQPDWQMPDQFINDALSVALYSDGLVSSHPISVPVDDPAEIGEIFDAISYEKGASIIRMLQSVIGENTFVAGLRKYLDVHKFGNAETNDLWTAMTKELSGGDDKLDIKSVMDTWTLQMGYPVVTVSRTGNQVHASQERFLYNPRGNLTEEFKSPFGYRWEIPLTYITDLKPQDLQPVQWMNKGDISFTVNDNPRWIKVNVNMTGFYRVHYDQTTWKALIGQLNNDHLVFSPADRASLISDAFALARSGHLNVTLALEMTRYLTKESDYIAWETALTSLNYIGDLLEGTPDYEFYKTYVRGLISKLCKDLGWDDTGSHVTKLLRASILTQSLKLNVEENVKQVQNIFADWINKNKPISPNLRSLVYMGGVKFGGDLEWRTVWKRFQEEQIPSEKSKLLYALCATTDALTLSRFLQYSLDEDKVRSAESPSVIQTIASNPAGRVLAWRFVRMNWDELHRRYHNVMMKMRRIILGSAGHFTTQFDYDEVQKFFLDHLQGENLRSVSQALDKISMNIDWLARNKLIVVDWLKQAVSQM